MVLNLKLVQDNCEYCEQELEKLKIQKEELLKLIPKDKWGDKRLCDLQIDHLQNILIFVGKKQKELKESQPNSIARCYNKTSLFWFDVINHTIYLKELEEKLDRMIEFLREFIINAETVLGITQTLDELNKANTLIYKMRNIDKEAELKNNLSPENEQQNEQVANQFLGMVNAFLGGLSGRFNPFKGEESATDK